MKSVPWIELYAWQNSLKHTKILTNVTQICELDGKSRSPLKPTIINYHLPRCPSDTDCWRPAEQMLMFNDVKHTSAVSDGPARRSTSAELLSAASKLCDSMLSHISFKYAHRLLKESMCLADATRRRGTFSSDVLCYDRRTCQTVCVVND